MALLWMKQAGDRRYEVRGAGATVRLYTNGVFHSQYNPHRPFSGGVWDLLSLPALLLPERPRVLLLGVGGGAVIRQLLGLAAPAEIVGVELDPRHLEIARRWFGVDAPEVTLHRGDAVAWLAEYDGPPFDLIVDDLFDDAGGEPLRAVAADAEWLAGLARHLAPHGAVVTNFPSDEELKGCGWFRDGRLRRHLKRAFRLVLPLYENAVGLFTRDELEAATLRRRANARPELRGHPYRIRRLTP